MHYGHMIPLCIRPTMFASRYVVPAAVALGVFMATGTAFAAQADQAAPMPAPDEPWMQHSADIMQRVLESENSVDPDSRITDEQRRWAQQIMDRTQQQLDSGDHSAAAVAEVMLPGEHDAKAGTGASAAAIAAQTNDADQPEYTVRVFTTLGEGAAGKDRFIDQIQALAGVANVKVLLRGLPEDMHYINNLMGYLGGVTRSVEDAPPILLAPKKFKQAGIDTAPTVVFYKDGQALARITGTLEIDWLKTQVEKGERGMLGARGPAHDIAERNLMALIRERWEAIDWAKKKEQAKAAYWDSYDATQLPTAKTSRRFTVDPSIIVARTIKTPRGRVVAHKGQRVNPLDVVPFTGAVIAFDGSDPEQVKLAAALVGKVRAEGLRPLPVTQGLPDNEPGFNAQAKLQRMLNAKIYLLDERVIDRFELEALPAVVRGEGGVFVIHEIEPKAALAELARTGDSDEK